MAVSAPTNEYLLLMRGGATWNNGLSPREVQEGLEAMMAWLEDLRARGLLTAGQPLAENGAVVHSADQVVMDGPFIESKEAVGGYLMLQAASLEEAMAAAQLCPVLKHGMIIEVRPIVSNCTMAEANDMDMCQVVR